MKKIVVDYDLCEANAFCTKHAPELFKVEDNDTLTVLNDQPGDALIAKAEKAVKYCPRGAIKLIEG